MTQCHLPPRQVDLFSPTNDVGDTGVAPQIILGDPVSGSGGDSTRTAFGKFNGHDHARSSHSFFTTTGAQEGDSVVVIDSAGVPIVPVGTSVVFVSPEKLTLSTPATKTEENISVLLQSLSSPAVLIPNCRVTKDSRDIFRNERPGFVEGRWLQTLATQVIPIKLSNPSAGNHALVLRIPFACLLTEAWFQTTLGTALVGLTANGFPVGQTLSISTALSGFSFNTSNFLPQGSRLRLNIQNPNNLAQIDVSLTLVKILS